MSGKLPWQFTEEEKDRQLPYLPTSLQIAPAQIVVLQAADVALDLRVDATEAAVISLDGRLDTAESGIGALEAADIALDGRLDPIEATLAAPPWLPLAGGTLTGPLRLYTGVATPLGAPLFIPSGPLLTLPEAGTIERLVDKLYFTDSSATRRPFALWESSGTSGRIPATTTDGRLYDSANFTRDSSTGTVGITTTDNTGLLVTDTTGVGELGVKIRTAGATSTAAQAGFDVGHSNSYRFTLVTAGTAGAAPFGGSAYLFVTGPTNGMRFFNGDVLKPIEFWNNVGGVNTLAFRAYNGVLQAGAAAITATSASTGIAVYFGKTGSKQLRIGDMNGYCWTLGRNSSTGDLEFSSTKNDGTDYVTNAITIGGGSGILKAAFGMEVTDLTPGQHVFATTSGRLTTTAPYAAKTANYTLAATDRTIRADATGGSFALTLPTAVGCTGREYFLKCISGTNTLTISTTSSQTIDGVTSLTLAQWDCLHVQSDGANWMVL